MQILRNQYDSDNSDLDKEIQGWQDDHKTLTSFEGYPDRDKKLREHLTKYATDHIKTKESKFSRDKKVYDGEQAYKWFQQTTYHRRGHYRLELPATNFDRMESDISSLSSLFFAPLGLHQDRVSNASNKIKNDGENNLPGQPRKTHVPNKDKISVSPATEWHSTEHTEYW